MSKMRTYLMVNGMYLGNIPALPTIASEYESKPFKQLFIDVMHKPESLLL